ncbi:hypothetical protein P153DRAFT_353788 [Dothidotthia symphoricarpi CBS 119687]|uniref:Uncharacterized protein n=1 Tax=Dothidotthia symphoricarpi CBS 119687 TaxID=1392245 RepID=A0A6A6AQG0_9PLEO|nr:uncharacterized protein P153DRAFT_353788 [Dothidotthia symphoricarpi CBS 119687]KAF2133433.1 hypothetical protein P153DRAFT_353788 [Dothidotthia symphoricarpi CBS 119687]
MHPLDGTTSSKPTTTTTTTPKPKPHKRISALKCIFLRKPRASTPASTPASARTPPNSTFACCPPDDDPPAPMRILSPRATQSEPLARAPTRHSLSFHRQSKTGGTGSGLMAAVAVGQELESKGAVMQMGREGVLPLPLPLTSVMAVGTPASPTREAALGSHPVVRGGEGEGDEEGESVYQTPVEEMENGDGYFGGK